MHSVTHATFALGAINLPFNPSAFKSISKKYSNSRTKSMMENQQKEEEKATFIDAPTNNDLQSTTINEKVETVESSSTSNYNINTNEEISNSENVNQNANNFNSGNANFTNGNGNDEPPSNNKKISQGDDSEPWKFNSDFICVGATQAIAAVGAHGLGVHACAIADEKLEQVEGKPADRPLLYKTVATKSLVGKLCFLQLNENDKIIELQQGLSSTSRYRQDWSSVEALNAIDVHSGTIDVSEDVSDMI